MDLSYTFGLGGAVSTKKASADGTMGFRLSDDAVSMGVFTGMGGSTKEGFNYSFGGNCGYNSDVGIKKIDSNGVFTDAISNGPFANAGMKYKIGFETRYEQDRYDTYEYEDTKTGTEYTGEVGLRFNASQPTHTNISAFGEYSNFGGDVDKSYGGKYQLSDGRKSMFAEVGFNEHNDEKAKPFVGIGANLDF